MKSSVIYFKRIMNELQSTWEKEEDLLTEQHDLHRGIRSSQVAALVLFLIEKGVIKE